MQNWEHRSRKPKGGKGGVKNRHLWRSRRDSNPQPTDTKFSTVLLKQIGLDAALFQSCDRTALQQVQLTLRIGTFDIDGMFHCGFQCQRKFCQLAHLLIA